MGGVRRACRRLVPRCVTELWQGGPATRWGKWSREGAELARDGGRSREHGARLERRAGDGCTARTQGEACVGRGGQGARGSRDAGSRRARGDEHGRRGRGRMRAMGA
jgi:hypothetical protein